MITTIWRLPYIIHSLRLKLSLLSQVFMVEIMFILFSPLQLRMIDIEDRPFILAEAIVL